MHVSDTGGSPHEQVLYAAGQGGYHTYRIPALCVTTRGTVLAFCEGRRDSRSDYGQIDLLLRRSEDGGRTWDAPRVVATENGMTCGNPAPVVDERTGRILMPFCKNLADGGEDLICRGEAPRTVWLTWSDDDGLSWAEPVEITADVKHSAWTWYATGPCHGIQLAGGRLLVPCDHVVGQYLDRRRDPHHSHVILSDDGGATWRIGGIVPEGTNECCAVETEGGAVCLNCRNRRGAGDRRAHAWSHDGGESFVGFGRDPLLIEPVCQASLCRLSLPADDAPGRVLFANPASTARQNLTLRLSEDECRTWSEGQTLYAGPTAYSDLAVLPGDDAREHQRMLCLYERGLEGPYEEIALARLSLAWMQGSAVLGAGDAP